MLKSSITGQDYGQKSSLQWASDLTHRIGSRSFLDELVWVAMSIIGHGYLEINFMAGSSTRREWAENTSLLTFCV
jgi:hypothetical protein